MGLNEEFDDRQTHSLAESEEYHPYEYQTENNTSWAGALPVKQCVSRLSLPTRARACADTFAEGCMTLALRRMLAV